MKLQFGLESLKDVTLAGEIDGRCPCCNLTFEVERSASTLDMTDVYMEDTMQNLKAGYKEKMKGVPLTILTGKHTDKSDTFCSWNGTNADIYLMLGDNIVRIRI
jgi:hypothetical protein